MIVTIFNQLKDSPEGRGILSPLIMVISTSESLRSGNELLKTKTKKEKKKKQRYEIGHPLV